MGLLLTLILFIWATLIEGLQCSDIEGYWYNQLGSEVFFEEHPDGTLKGEYRTAVEKAVGMAGNTFASINGLTTRQMSGSIVAFTTDFNNGKSVASWGGQCLECGAEARIETTWLVKELATTCDKEWATVMINEDLFSRQSTTPGPRKLNDKHIPERPANWDSNLPNENLISEHIINLERIVGLWFTTEGHTLELRTANDGKQLNGSFIDPKYFAKSARLIGTVSAGGLFGLTVADEEHKTAAISVGQYHVCEGKEVIETYWLRINERQSCGEGHPGLNFRKIRFTRIAVVEHAVTEKTHFSTMFSDFSNSVSNFFLNMFGRKQ